MLDRKKGIKQKNSSIKSFAIIHLSQIFYKKSNIVIALFLTAIFISYLFLVMIDKAAGFELADSNIKSLGTSFGFDQAEIMIFLAARTDEMIRAYINFNQVWDAFFGLTYGLMYVVWVSVLFKPFSHKVGILNLFPLVQVVFDWLENYELALLANQYLADGMISSSNAQLASVFSMIKWACSGLTFALILIGIVLVIARKIINKKQTKENDPR
jgi:hypothetical protein